jgi:hypothetical protein
MIKNTRIMEVESYEDFRDRIPHSGLFEMTDCTLEVWCPMESDVAEVQRMVTLVESMVHVTDVEIGSRTEDLLSDKYSVVITEIKNDIRKKYLR